jgi:hypothetical protein
MAEPTDAEIAKMLTAYLEDCRSGKLPPPEESWVELRARAKLIADLCRLQRPPGKKPPRQRRDRLRVRMGDILDADPHSHDEGNER